MRGFVQQAMAHPAIAGAMSTFRAEVPQLWLEIDRHQGKTMDVSLNEVFGSVQAQLGSEYVNDFNKYGKVYRVTTQADDHFRMDQRDIDRLFVRNQGGDMVPLNTLATTELTLGTEIINRYNLFSSATINATPALGKSTGDAIAAFEQIAAETLPDGYGFEWTGMTYQELSAGNLAPILFALAVVFTYLFFSRSVRKFQHSNRRVAIGADCDSWIFCRSAAGAMGRAESLCASWFSPADWAFGQKRHFDC